MASITGPALPGLLTVSASGRFTDGSSAGSLEIEASPFVFAPAIERNGFTGSASAGPHRVGFSLLDESGPIGGLPVDEPLGFVTASAADDQLAGLNLRRHRAVGTTGSGVASRYRLIIDHELSASGLRSVAFALWSHVGAESTGFFGGRPAHWGAYVYGVPTAAGASLPALPRDYRGLAGEHYLFPDTVVNRFTYATVEARYEPSTLSLVVTITPRDRNQLAIGPGGSLSSSTGAIDPAGIPVFTEPLSCRAAVDPATATFACELPAVNGRLSGRFYGGQAEELAAVYHRWVPSGSSTNWGPLGALAARAVP